MTEFIAPTQNLDEWASSAKAWLSAGLPDTALVLGDIICDHYIEGVAHTGRALGSIFSFRYSESAEASITVPGGAAMGFLYASQFVRSTLLGTVGVDVPGEQILRSLHSHSGGTIQVRRKQAFVTPHFHRLYCSSADDKGQHVRLFRLDKYDPATRSAYALSVRRLKRELGRRHRGQKTLLLYDHGLGAITPTLLEHLATTANASRKGSTTSRFGIVARLKHSDARMYRNVPLNAIILNWHHITRTLAMPSADEHVRSNPELQRFLISFLSEFPHCANFVFFGLGGDVLALSRSQGTQWSSELHHLKRVGKDSERKYYSGAGHLFAAVLGMALASKLQVRPQSAVSLAYCAAIMNRRRQSREAPSTHSLALFLDTVPLSELFQCTKCAELHDSPCSTATQVLRPLLQSRKIQLRSATRDLLAIPARSSASRRFFSSLIGSVRGGELPSVIWIYGESGTGKTRAANALHKTLRRTGVFAEIKCNKLTPGAARKRIAALGAGGTVVFDEIGVPGGNALQIRHQVMSLLDDLMGASQRDLLVILTSSQHPVDVQPIDLAGRIEQVGSILEIPCMLETIEDIPYLVAERIIKHNRESRPAVRSITGEVLAKLVVCDYRRENQRRLAQIVRGACTRARDGRIVKECLPPEIQVIRIDHLIDSQQAKLNIKVENGT